ncbi:MAG TPA: DUF6152 family protein [Terriglobia bacterium]|nr:DUF6152 family protein [Terriglobia bacterium]
MKRPQTIVILFAVLAILSGMPVSSAHHATATEYDISRTITLKGAVAGLNWANPHVHIDLKVKQDADGEETWDVEFGSPGAMAVAGITKESLPVGATVVVKAYPAKVKGTRTRACAIEATLPDGSTTRFVVGV